VPLAKKTSKNQITLPRAVVERFPGVRYFDVREEEGRIVLRPVRPDGADEVRRKLAALKIEERDIAAAVRWARKPRER
jgi:bifunctional DNA-binding transcriptional regulator/antitoxin component of YhaV-PrlF toxin-antitoxin module